MIIISQDYWKGFMDQGTGSKPLDKVEIEISAGTWTDVTDYYLGGGTFDSEKERAPDIISAGDTTYTMDNSDHYFTPTDSGSIFYGNTYIGKKIRFQEGFYGLGYYPQSTMVIKDIEIDHGKQLAYIICQEAIQRVVDEDLNSYPSALIPVANAGNTGNGTITEIVTMPLAVGEENWTLTCTTLGGDAVGIFEVSGSVSGDIGDATSGTEFSDSTAGIKFTITAGGVDWAAGDIFTFTTYQYPEWTTTDIIKIIWSLLTGYNYDTDVQENWAARVLDFDHTKSVDNTDLNYNSFVNAIADVNLDLTGYVDYDRNAAEVMQELLIHFLGSLYTDNEGRIAVSSYKPSFGAVTIREFSDDKKVFDLDYGEKASRMINQVTVYCKRAASWAWSNADETTDDVYSASNSTSVTTYGIRNPLVWDDFYWHSSAKAAQKWFADRIVDKFGQPPKEFKFETGLDGMRQNLADRIMFTDSRTSVSGKLLEINRIEKDFESQPKIIRINAWDSNTTGARWMFYGSSVAEGDGISPQTAGYDAASDTDKQFGYYSQTGGEGSDPEYYYF